MNVIETKFPGLLLIEPDVFGDSRGFFMECYHDERYSALGIAPLFRQDNISQSVRGTIRGLHFQTGAMSQGKLCQVIEGEVQDVAVDLRVGSPTYGQAYSAILSGEIHNQIWIPVGFAHGFAVLSESAIFHYKCTTAYSKSSERTLLFNDPVLQIDWLVRNPILSEKDLQGVPLAGLPIDFYFYEAGG